MYPLEKIMLGNIRKNIMKEANGNCLEIAFGTGVNMPYYDRHKISEFHAVDIYKQDKIFNDVIYHVQSAETLPFSDKSFDTIILTLALCTIPDNKQVLSEIHRCLKDDGKYLFLEHVQETSNIGRKIFNKLSPIWSIFTGGCRINLETIDLISNCCFSLELNKKGIFRYGVAYKNLES